MKANKNVSRRQFLLLGTLTGGGLVLSESSCVNQTASSGSGTLTGSAKSIRTFLPRKGSPLPILNLLTLRQVVSYLKNCSPVLRDVENNIVTPKISGTVISNNPEFDTPLGQTQITMYHFMNDLLPSIEITVSGVTYVLTVAGGTNDQTLLVKQSLRDIFKLLPSFCIHVKDTNGNSHGSYTVSGAPLYSENCNPGPYQAIGLDTLDIIGDSLGLMEVDIDRCTGTLSARANPSPHLMTLYVLYNKHRHE